MPYKDPEKRRAKNREWYHANRDKRRAGQQRWKDANREKHRATQRRGELRRDYGLTPEAVEAKMTHQLGQCEICPRDIREKSHVDHCHVTGLNRGILCPKCNQGLGLFDHDPANLRAAAEYLERYSTPGALSEQLSGPSRGPLPHPATQTAPSP